MPTNNEQAAPGILNPEPVPEPQMRSFHRHKILGWSGKVKVDQVHGWVRNRRIDLFVRDFERRFGREPTNDEVYEHMRSEEREYQLRPLAKSIADNGMRMAIILDADGTLLDGNRRYFATRYAIDNRMDRKEELENIPAWVLTENATQFEKDLVLIETNFLPSYKIDWPQYVKARVMYEDYERGEGLSEIAKRYGMTSTRVRSMVKAMELVEEFINHVDDPDDASVGEQAEIAAYKYFTLFEEAHNKLRGQLDSDAEFKDHFFKWMLEEKFQGGINEIRRLGDIRNDEEAWEAIRQPNPDAVKRAVHIVDDKKLPDAADGERKVKRVIGTLRDLKEHEIASITRDTMLQLRQILNDVMAMAIAVNTSRLGTPDAVDPKEIKSSGHTS